MERDFAGPSPNERYQSESSRYAAACGFGSGAATIRFRYHKIAAILKWLALVPFFAYVIAGRPDRPRALEIGNRHAALRRD
jgi:hypothetical protein